MKRWKILSLAVLALALYCGVAWAAQDVVPGEPRASTSGLASVGGKLYAVQTVEWHTRHDDNDYVYYPSRVVEYDGLNSARAVELTDGQNSARNTDFFVAHNGKLYAGSFGGAMGSGDLGWGDVWEVDPATMTARRILGLETLGFPNYAGIVGFQIAADGTAWLLTGGYFHEGGDDDWNFTTALFTTTIERMSVGDAGTKTVIPTGGGTPTIMWSEYDQTLYLRSSYKIEARAKDGVTVLKDFTQLELGGRPVGMQGEGMLTLEGRSGLFYITSENYSVSSVGLITKSGDVYTPQTNLVTALSGNTSCHTFLDKNGKAGILLNESITGGNDVISIYNPDDFATPVMNVSNLASGISNLVKVGDWLYYGANVSPDDLSSTINRMTVPDLSTGDGDGGDAGGNNNTGGGGGGGCDAGFGAAALLFLVPAVLRRFRKK